MGRAVLNMQETICKGKLPVEDYVKLAKDKTSGVKLLGFGHRMYKNSGPRAQNLQIQAEKPVAHLNVDNLLLDIGRQPEDFALSDSNFIDRRDFTPT